MYLSHTDFALGTVAHSRIPMLVLEFEEVQFTAR